MIIIIFCKWENPSIHISEFSPFPTVHSGLPLRGQDYHCPVLLLIEILDGCKDYISQHSLWLDVAIWLFG